MGLASVWLHQPSQKKKVAQQMERAVVLAYVMTRLFFG